MTQDDYIAVIKFFFDEAEREREKARDYQKLNTLLRILVVLNQLLILVLQLKGI